jgi:hypothetical protein
MSLTMSSSALGFCARGAHIKRHGPELLTTTVQRGVTLDAGVVVVVSGTLPSLEPVPS